MMIFSKVKKSLQIEAVPLSCFHSASLLFVILLVMLSLFHHHCAKAMTLSDLRNNSTSFEASSLLTMSCICKITELLLSF